MIRYSELAFLGHSAQQKTGKMPTFEIKKRVYYVGRLRIVIRLICRADCYIFQNRRSWNIVEFGNSYTNRGHFGISLGHRFGQRGTARTRRGI